MIQLKFKSALILFISVLVLGCSCFAQESPAELAREIESLKQGQEAIRKELQEIKNLLRAQKVPVRRPPAVNVRNIEFELPNNLISGDKSAKLVLVNFTDYQ